MAPKTRVRGSGHCASARRALLGDNSGEAPDEAHFARTLTHRMVDGRTPTSMLYCYVNCATRQSSDVALSPNQPLGAPHHSPACPLLPISPPTADHTHSYTLPLAPTSPAPAPVLTSTGSVSPSLTASSSGDSGTSQSPAYRPMRPTAKRPSEKYSLVLAGRTRRREKGQRRGKEEQEKRDGPR